MFNNILIIGCGLIGSSILRASLKKKISKNYYVFEKSQKFISVIKKINKNIKFLKSLDKNLNQMDLVILGTPMSAYSKFFSSLNKNLNHNSIITDVGSTKENLINLRKKKLSKNLDWVMSHPISGSEVSGPEHGSPNLFKNKWCIIIKDKNTLKQKKIERFWKKLGSKIIIMNSDDHDKIFSVTSHLPHLIAYNLIKTAQDFQKKRNKNLIKFSAGGLRDFSRIAASNEIMWRDIFFANKTNMIDAINVFAKNLNDFKKNISRKENSKLLKKLINSKVVRKQIISQKQDISKPDFGRE